MSTKRTAADLRTEVAEAAQALADLDEVQEDCGLPDEWFEDARLRWTAALRVADLELRHADKQEVLAL